MKYFFSTWLISLLFTPILSGQQFSGFFDFNYDENKGHIILEVPQERIGEAFLYIHSLSEGVGSNDIGLDRGQLGKTRIVRFEKAGGKLLLIQENHKYRAESDNPFEVKAVEDAFAKAVIWGFVIKEDSSNVYRIDITNFLLQDRHLVAEKLLTKKQGSYKMDQSKSAIQMDRTRSFPDNTEFEALTTFVGKPDNNWIKEVSIDDHIISVGQHHSFVRLPDDNYTPRVFSPACGYRPLSYVDYASPIGTDMTKRLITRHRLQVERSANGDIRITEPIIYYLDRGCPEPIRSALLDGARWWSQAFEFAGFKDAFQVKLLPEDADPLDVRYNVIQWVHRKTRGWSYGASVTDPRTGEIIKGHVSLGSLRVRQDYMIAQAIRSALDEQTDDPIMLEMALARLRQLSAHEVGHTLGLTHNFAASADDRSSVMDYPHPLIKSSNLTDTDFGEAYAIGIGLWDKYAIEYGYAINDGKLNERDFLNSILVDAKKSGLKFITDQDSRPVGGLHPHAHLWDNGSDPIAELHRLIQLRKKSLGNMGMGSLREGQVFSELEKLLVPTYLMHRYQVEAVSKLIGGVEYEYSVHDGQSKPKMDVVSEERQVKATEAMLVTLDAAFLEIPESLLELIPPPAFGYPRDRESFKGNTGLLFDPMIAAEASANHTLSFMLNPERLSRLLRFDLEDMALQHYLRKISQYVFETNGESPIALAVQKVLYIHYLKLANDLQIDKQVQACAEQELSYVNSEFLGYGKRKRSSARQAHNAYLRKLYGQSQNKLETLKLPGFAKMPPGSPIGCDAP